MVSYIPLKEGRASMKITDWIYRIENNDVIRVGKNTRYKE